MISDNIYKKISKIQTPNKIIEKINQIKNETNDNQPIIIPNKIKTIKISTNYQNNLKTYNNQNKYNNYEYTYRTSQKNKILNTSSTYNNNNTQIYNKKKLNNYYYTSSSGVTSGKNSFISNPDIINQNSNKNNNVNPIENIPYKNCTEFQIKNQNDIKTKTIKSPNQLIQSIYQTEDYFNKNIKEGFLYLKNYEIIKPNNYNFININNLEIEKRKKDISHTLNRFLNKRNLQKNFSYSEKKNLKNFEIKSLDAKRDRKRDISKKDTSKRDLSEQPKNKKLKVVKKGKILNILNYFNNKDNLSDILIIRGMRNEKGGVVDFTTASPQKNYNIINKTNSKNYKYSKKEIITSAKIIQKWWRKKVLLYNNYINKIKLIQKTFMNYYNRKNKKNENNNDNNTNKLKEIPKNNKFILMSIRLLKKVIEVKLINIFSEFMIKTKNKIIAIQNQTTKKEKYNYLITSIKDYFNKIKNKNQSIFINKLKSKLKSINKFKIIKLSNIFIKGKKSEKNYNNKFINPKSNLLIKPKNEINKKKNILNRDLKEDHNIKININVTSLKKNKNKFNNKKNDIHKKSCKITFNEKDLNINSKNPNEICIYLLKKLYIRKWYNKMIAIKNAKRARVDEWNKRHGKNSHLLLKNIMIDIIEKIRKEANRRTLIIAFRDINNLKYPILFYALLKIKKYSIVKYNVLNAYAKLIQKNYKYFKNKKSRINQFFIIE